MSRCAWISHGPREKSPMHGHPEMVTTFLTDGHFRFTYPDGKTEDITEEAGVVRRFDAFTHLPENTSMKRFEAIAVELKP